MFRFNSNIHIFGKREINGHCRLGALLARDISVEKTLEKVERAYAKLDVKL
ncbi:phosphoribosylglycinamide formyltransferase [Haemophilus haemolyticus]|uniref:phosphoribosylglycinamide formyltransferase n=1 Tax=Haemophilus haemolyticus TaxID=726 RepID=UPI003B98418F